MAKLFVSYSRKDSAVARKLIQAFKDMGQDVWVDWEDIPPAVDWLEQIFRGIEGSDAFLFLISPDSVASEVCNVEVGRAAQNNKRVIPIVVRDVDPKITNETIRKLNWTFIREQDVFEEGLAKVKTGIELDLPWVEEHNRLQSRALEWHRKKEPSLLLRGKDLRNARSLVMTAAKKDPTPTNLQQLYIHHSNQDERRRNLFWFATAFAVIALASLTIFAFIQQNRAEMNEALAIANERQAQINEARAVENKIQAELNAAEAEKQAEEARKAKVIAEAQRSAAKAQIYQSRTGELYTSTLLAIDSWQGSESDEAEEILRRNISLLPLPVAQFGHLGKINSMQLNPNGDVVLTASADKTICAWNLEDGTELFCANSPGSVNDAIFSPDGNLIVTGDESGLVQILSAENGAMQFQFTYETPIQNVDIRSDGKLLAVTEDDGNITMINLERREESFFLKATGRVFYSGFSPNGKFFASGSDLGIVTLWNLDTNEIFSRNKHRGEVLAIEFSPNSRYLVSGGKDGYSVFTFTSSGEDIYKRLHEDWVEDIAFSPDSSWYATVSHDKRIRVWDAVNSNERIRMSQESFVDVVEVSPNGQWIATTGSDKTVRVWNASTGAEMFQIPLTSGGAALAFSDDGRYLITGDDSGALGIWDISIMPAPEKYFIFDGIAGDVQFNNTGDVLYASDENRIWSLNPNASSTLTVSPQDEQKLELKSTIKEFLLSLDSDAIGISTVADQVFIHYINENRTSKALNITGSIEALAFYHDGGQLITATSNGMVQAWNPGSDKSNEPLIVFEGESATSLASAQSLLAMGMTNRILVIDLTSNQIFQEIESPGGHPNLALNSDGNLLASANATGQIQIWGNKNGKFTLLHSISKESASSIVFNSTGNILAIGTSSSVILIDTSLGEEIARIPHSDNVNGLSFSTNENILATASSRFIQLWDISKIAEIKSDSLVEVACSRMIANFNAAQWTAFFGAEEFRRLCENLP